MFLLDTNFVSELRKVRSDKADPPVAAWANSRNRSRALITVQEFELGVLLAERRDPAQGGMLRTWLGGHVLPAFEGSVLPVDITAALRSAKLHVPDRRPVRDGLIAATALGHGMQVVTRNTSDFEPAGVTTLNPWSWPR